MSQLFLLRHAKSSWDDALLDDRERPLAPRGRRATDQICAYLVEDGISPALVLCSSALRTRQTLGALLPAFRSEATIHIEDGLYGADAETLLQRIRRVPAAVPSVLLIGHNPGIQDLAARLADGDPPGAAIADGFPTGALATFDVRDDWGTMDGQSATAVGFVTPREL
jgi:phosphohistidine phosphatase